jgi:hypothetical protein
MPRVLPGSLQHRIVRPAILSIIGTYSPFYIAAVYWPLASMAGGFGLVLGIGGILEPLLAGAWLCTISILLLLDNVRHRIWGLLAAISYTIAFPSLFFYSWFLTSSQGGILTREGAWLAIIAPLVGLIGGVWGFLWKSSTTATTPGTVDMKAPSLSRLPRDKPVIPALLSIAGTALPLYLLYVFVGALFAPPQPPQEGSVGPDFGFILVPLLVGGAAFLVLLPMVFSIFLLFDPRRHRAWGAVLTVWWGLPSAYLLVAIVVDLVNGGFTVSQGPSWPGIVFTPFLGLAGGVWGFFWHTGVNPRAWTSQTIARAMRGLSGRVMLGGWACIVCAIFASPALAILPSVLVVGNMLLGRRSVRSRARGAALMGLVVASGLSLLAFEVVEYLNAYWEVGPRVAGLAGLVAIVVAGSGLVWSIRGPLIPRWKRLSTTVVFAVLVSVLAGSILLYGFNTIQAYQNRPKPNVAITNIRDTYTQDCGPSGSQTTTFNMTLTLVNTGGNGIATIGYDLNGQQVSSEGYYIEANSQLPIINVVIAHACYGAAVPTYTAVLLSEQAA